MELKDEDAVRFRKSRKCTQTGNDLIQTHKRNDKASDKRQQLQCGHLGLEGPGSDVKGSEKEFPVRGEAGFQQCFREVQGQEDSDDWGDV